MEPYERQISGEELPPGKWIDRKKSYKKNVLEYHIPFEGFEYLLTLIPQARILWQIQITIRNNELVFEIISFLDDPDQINRKIDDIIQNLKQQCINLSQEVTKYNDTLYNIAENTFNLRKKIILEKGDFLASLNVPLKKNNNISDTFSVPKVRKKIKTKYKKPEVAEKGFRPEATLDNSSYREILALVHDVGKQFERHPSTYSDKDEETLRDHILLMLEPNFEGTATGETFNKTGKTDILLRHESSNIFVAECKFWSGEKNYIETINQLLGYLTWRDSKTAVILFVRNKDFSSVLTTIDEVTPNHPNYIKKLEQSDETWSNWLLHLPDDENRGVYVAVMAYHIPPIDSAN
jgi:hypothetical protein